MEKREVIGRLEQILETDVLVEDDSISPITWDSIEILGTISLIDEAGHSAKIADILGCKSVGDILRLAGCR